MTDLSRLPTRDARRRLRAVVEAPRGARVKLTYEPEIEAFEFGRALPLGMHYPYDWGFFPSTRAADGDPLDAMIFHDTETYPGVVVACRPLGVVLLTQRGDGRRRERNDRVIAVPHDARLDEVRAVPARVRDEIERFFLSVVFFEPKDARVEGWQGPRAAERVIREAQRRYEREAHGERSRAKT